MSYAQSVEVVGLSLDEFVVGQGHPAPQVVKMDIEGGEVLALPGMRRLLREHPPLIFLELHGPQAAQVTWDMLYTVGYRLCRMAPNYPLIPSLQALDWKAYVVAMPSQVNQ